MTKATEKNATVVVRFQGVKALSKTSKERIGKKVLAAVKAEVERSSKDVSGQEDGWVSTGHCTFCLIPDP